MLETRQLYAVWDTSITPRIPKNLKIACSCFLSIFFSFLIDGNLTWRTSLPIWLSDSFDLSVMNPIKPFSFWTLFSCLFLSVSKCSSSSGHHQSYLILWWFILVSNLASSGINSQTSPWTYQWGIFLEMFNWSWKRHTGCGAALPSRSPNKWKSEKEKVLFFTCLPSCCVGKPRSPVVILLLPLQLLPFFTASEPIFIHTDLRPVVLLESCTPQSQMELLST